MQNPVPLENDGCQSISFLTENFPRKSFQELPIEEQKIPSDKIYSRENGFQQAGCAWGNPDILQTCLNLILRDYRGEEDSRRNSYKALVEALKRESMSLESQKKDFEKQLVDLDANSEIVAKKSRISELKEEIRELQANPKKILPDEDVSNKATFFVSLIELGDWIFPNTHPYFHRFIEPVEAAEWTERQYQKLVRKTEKPVLFKEVGLPSDGDEGMNEQNQAEYYRQLQQKSVHFVYFEAFDQLWKTHLPIEPHWGLFRSDRSPKLVVEYLPSK